MLQDEILTLENDRDFCVAMETYAASITPALYRLRKKNDRSLEKVPHFYGDTSFLSFGVDHMYNVHVGDLISKHLRLNGLNDLYGNDRGKLIGVFTQYYIREIKLGNSFLKSSTFNALELHYIKGATKKASCVVFGGSMYSFNKELDHFSKDAFINFHKVYNRELKYTDFYCENTK